MSDAQVGIIMGSKSDLEVMKQAGVVLKQFGVPFEITVVSASKTDISAFFFFTIS